MRRPEDKGQPSDVGVVPPTHDDTRVRLGQKMS